MIFETTFQCSKSDNRIIIPLDPEWDVLGIQISGGLDSALLTFLTAKTIKENGLKTKIRPISCDVGNKPDYLPTARKVRQKLKEVTGFDQWAEPYEYKIPLRESVNPYKLYCSTNHLKALLKVGHINYEFNGVTKNPPAEVRQHFRNDDHRQAVRDNPETIYSGTYSARPLAFCDKQGVIEFYKTYGLFDTILPLTLSCDVNIEHMENGQLPCRKCWWCDERKWALEVNGEDPNL